MEKNIDFEAFDAEVDRFLRHQMTTEEEQIFKSELSANPEKKERARTIALMVRAMQQQGQQRDQHIVEGIGKMDENQFRLSAGLPFRLNSRSHMTAAIAGPEKVIWNPGDDEAESRSVSLWRRITSYGGVACIAGLVGLFSWGGYRYQQHCLTVDLGQREYLAYTMDFSADLHYRGDVNLTELETLFAHVRDGVDLESTIKGLESLHLYALQDYSVYNEFLDDISWNLAIAYLKDGEREKPVPILQGMIDRNKDYPQIAQPAQNLLDEIEEL